MNLKKILIVDDDAVVRTRITRLLKRYGYEPIAASDGSDAVSIARKEVPALILLDISFPPDVAHGGGVPWDGFLIIDWLRRMEEAKDIPIILMTASSLEAYQQQARARGALGLFQKPINEEALIAVIQKTVGEGEPPPVPPGPPGF